MRMHFGRNFLVVAGIIMLFNGITEMVCLGIAGIFAAVVIIKRLCK